MLWLQLFIFSYHFSSPFVLVYAFGTNRVGIADEFDSVDFARYMLFIDIQGKAIELAISEPTYKEIRDHFEDVGGKQ